MAGQLPHLRIVRFLDFGRVMRVYADTRVDPIVRLGYRNTAPHLFRPAAVAYRQDRSNAGVPRALQHSVAVGVEARIVEMCVGIDEHGTGYFNLAPFSTSS